MERGLKYYIKIGDAGTWQELPNSPDGFDTSLFNVERSVNYYGIFRSFTIPLKFHKYAGATIIRDSLYTNGFSSLIFLKIEKLNKITLQYSTEFSGKLDFTTFKDTDEYVECNVIDGGLAEIIKNKEGEDQIINISTTELLAYAITRIDSDSVPPPVNEEYVHGITFRDMFRCIIDVMTNGGILSGKYAFKSDFLDIAIHPMGWQNWVYLVPEFIIEYINQSYDALEFQTTLSDCFKSLNTNHPIGMGIEIIDGIETVLIESREYFFKQEEIVSVGEAKKLQLYIASDYNICKIKSGNEKQDYNGTESFDSTEMQMAEFNTETIFSIPNMTTEKEYDLSSPYRSDWQGVVDIYASETEKTTDYGIFKILCRPKYLEELNIKFAICSLIKSDQPGYVKYTGNGDLSPKFSILRHRNFINSCLYGLNNVEMKLSKATNDQQHNKVFRWSATIDHDIVYFTDTLPFSTSNPSYFMTEEYKGLIIEEPLYFKPIQIIIEAIYPGNMITLINAKPYGYISGTYLGVQICGFIHKMEVKQTNKSSVKYTLLSTASNDLKKLIR